MHDGVHSHDSDLFSAMAIYVHILMGFQICTGLFCCNDNAREGGND